METLIILVFCFIMERMAQKEKAKGDKLGVLVFKIGFWVCFVTLVFSWWGNR